MSNENEMVEVSVRIPRSMRKKLKNCATNEDKYVSNILRKLIKNYIQGE